MNCYATINDVKSDLNLTNTTSHDATLLLFLESVSRGIDRFCGRHFYAKTDTKYHTSSKGDALLLDGDILSVTTLETDSEGDGTYDGESWTENTDFYLQPNGFPKNCAITTGFGDYGFSTSRRNIKVVGSWGYGDGLSATPWLAVGTAGTVADTTTATLTLSADNIVKAGHTILVDSEQMFVTAVTTGSCTVERGVNGTTASAQSSETVSIAEYPKDVTRIAAWLAVNEFKQRDTAGMQQERMGDYFYTKLTTDVSNAQSRVLGPYVRVEAI